MLSPCHNMCRHPIHPSVHPTDNTLISIYIVHKACLWNQVEGHAHVPCHTDTGQQHYPCLIESLQLYEGASAEYRANVHAHMSQWQVRCLVGWNSGFRNIGSITLRYIYTHITLQYIYWWRVTDEHNLTYSSVPMNTLDYVHWCFHQVINKFMVYLSF